MSFAGQPDALTRLGTALDEAVGEGHLGEKPQAPDDKTIRARLRVVGLYLFLLGYLGKHPASGTGDDKSDNFYAKVHDEQIQEAVARFQRDAGLVDDGWVGSETWKALQELAGFEHPTNIDRWFADEKPLPVLRRAVHLRLFAYGLTKLAPQVETNSPQRNKQRNRDYEKGLDGFAHATRLLNSAEGDVKPALIPATLTLLFDQDGICERIETCLNRADGLPKDKPDRQHAIDFMKRAAAIELWLYGYNVSVGNFKEGGPFVSPARNYTPFALALKDFNKDHGHGAKKEAIDTLTWFFGHIGSLYRETPDLEGTEDADEAVQKILDDPKMGKEVEKTIPSLGARLWDGVKRVANWIKSLLKSLFQTVKKIAKRIITNISRFIHEAALKIYSHVVAAIRAVSNGIDFLKEEILLGSDPQHMIVMHDGDLDFDVFVNTAADPGRVRNLSERIVLRSEIFGVGAKILSKLISFFVSFIRGVAMTGWFAVMLALVKLYKTYKQLREFSKRALALFSELDLLRAQA